MEEGTALMGIAHCSKGACAKRGSNMIFEEGRVHSWLNLMGEGDWDWVLGGRRAPPPASFFYRRGWLGDPTGRGSFKQWHHGPQNNLPCCVDEGDGERWWGCRSHRPCSQTPPAFHLSEHLGGDLWFPELLESVKIVFMVIWLSCWQRMFS